MAQEKVALSKIAGSNFAHILWQRHISQKEFAAIVGRTPRKRQTSSRIKGRHLKETVAHRDGGQLFLRYIAFFRGICGKQAFSPCLVSFAQLRRSLQDPQQVSVRI